MASIIASLPPPLLLRGRNSFPGNFQNFPVSLLPGNPLLGFFFFFAFVFIVSQS